MVLMWFVNIVFDTFWGDFTGVIGGFGIMSIDKT